MRGAQAAARRPPGRAPKLPVALPPWHAVGRPAALLRQAYGGLWGFTGDTPAAHAVPSASPAALGFPPGPLRGARGADGQPPRGSESVAVVQGAADPAGDPAAARTAAPTDAATAACGSLAGSDRQLERSEDAARLRTVDGAHAAVAKGAPRASWKCMRVLVGRLHAAVRGWDVTLGAAAASRRESGTETAGGWMRVRLRVAAKGACESGAAVCLCDCTECLNGAGVDGGPGSGCCGEPGRGVVIGFITTTVSPAMAGWGGGLATVSAAAVGAAADGASSGAASWLQRLYIINPYAASTRRPVAVF